MNQVVEAGDGIEMVAVVEDVLVDEAGQQKQVWGFILREDLRKNVGEFGQMLAVPQRCCSVHWRSQHHTET